MIIIHGVIDWLIESGFPPLYFWSDTVSGFKIIGHDLVGADGFGDGYGNGDGGGYGNGYGYGVSYGCGYGYGLGYGRVYGNGCGKGY